MATVSESINNFLEVSAAKSKPLTVRAYSGRLASFRRQHGSRQVSEITAEEISAWLLAQQTFPDGRTKAPDTIRLTVIAFELWQKWLIGTKQIAKPWLDRQKKPAGRRRTALPSLEETRKILANAPPDFQLIYRALRLTGARPNELVRATIADVDARRGLLVLQDHKTVGKTHEPREIALGHPEMKKLLAQVVGDRTAGEIFLRSCGKPWTVGLLSSTYRKLRDRAGLPKCLVLYLARHEHATQLYRRTKDLKTVAAALGHKQLSTSDRYAHIDAETLNENQQLFEEGL